MCMYIYTHIYIDIYRYISIYVCIYTYLYICICTYTHILYIQICVYVCMCIHLRCEKRTRTRTFEKKWPMLVLFGSFIKGYIICI